MIAIPAVDLREGSCVQLVGGSFDAEQVRLDEPPAIASSWWEIGFRRLHVVDLDAAMGTGSNDDTVRRILADARSKVQVGGGVRSTNRIQELLDAGASRVVVGTRAIEDAAWLADCTARYPGTLIVAADVRDRNLVTHGWKRTHPLDIVDFIRTLSGLSLGGLLVTAVHLEGRMRGADLGLMADVVDAAACSVIASGGVTTVSDLRALEQRGVAAAVIGMALYTGALDARAVAQEFNE